MWKNVASLKLPNFLFTPLHKNGHNSCSIVEQIEKFHSLNISTTQGLSAGTLRLHLATCHVPETCLKVSQLWHGKTQKTRLIWFDGQWGLQVYPLSLQKTCVTSLGEFSTLLELRGEVCILDLQHVKSLHWSLYFFLQNKEIKVVEHSKKYEVEHNGRNRNLI